MTDRAPARCPRCLGAERFCICDALTCVPCTRRVVVLQHVLEQSEVSNTGRFIPLVLRGAELRPHGVKEAPLVTDDLAGAVLLFPDERAPQPKPSDVTSLVVVDASWSQARRMVQRIPALRSLPRISLKVNAPEKSLRDAPPGGLSTLQALARTLALLGDERAAAALERVHARLVARTLAARGYV
ncbi:MAG: DTW domain-containing protein [Myxococcota bacterium]